MVLTRLSNAGRNTVNGRLERGNAPNWNIRRSRRYRRLSFQERARMKTVVAGKPIIVMGGKYHKGFGYGREFKNRRGVLKCKVALKTTQKEHEVNASYVCKNFLP